MQLEELDEAGHRLQRYVLHFKDGRQDTTKEIIETRDGEVARTVAVDGKAWCGCRSRQELPLWTAALTRKVGRSHEDNEAGRTLSLIWKAWCRMRSCSGWRGRRRAGRGSAIG